mmetsp:Transcript_22369/g.21546  ORF Transcript_22369/g.21546 Transcript_22369/m.21546 type:complete len:467 (-) Transcript_22369:500-1900(-)
MLENDLHFLQISKEKFSISEITMVKLQTKTVLVLMFNNCKIMVYEYLESKEKFRFKIVQASALKKLRPLEGCSRHCQKLIVDQNQITVLHPAQALQIFERKGKLYFYFLSQGPSQQISSFSPFSLYVKGIGKMNSFVFVESTQSSLNIARVPLVFDVKKSQRLAENFIIKQIPFEKQAIKKLTLFTSSQEENFRRYLILASFSTPKDDASFEVKNEQGIQVPQGQVCDRIKYEISIFKMPEDNDWRSYSTNFYKDQCLKISDFLPDEIITCLEEVKLKGVSGKIKNYIGVSTLKLDSQMIEEGFYSSHILLYDIKQNRVANLITENCKGTITCLTHYQGYLTVVQRSKIIKDFAIVFYRFNEISQKLDSQHQPQSINTLGTSISFDGDLIFVGDLQKNLQVLWLCDEKALSNEKVEDMNQIMKLKKQFSNVMDTYVIGAYNLRIAPVIDPLGNQYTRLTEVQKQQM